MSRRGVPPWAVALQEPQFRKLLGVISSQNTGFWFIFPGLQLTVAARTSNDPIALGMLFFVTMVPILLFSLHAGAHIDQHDRIKVLNLGQSFMVVTAIATALSVAWENSPVWLVFLCAAFIGVSFAITLPAQQALLANSVPVHLLPNAVTLNAMAMNLARMIGPGIAAIAITVIGTPFSILVYGIAGGVGIVLTRTLTLPRFPKDRTTLEQPKAVTVRAGIVHARSRPPTIIMLLLVAVASLFGMSFVTQTPVIAAQSSANPQAFLLLVSAGGLGSFFGIAFVARNIARVTKVTVAVSILGILGALVVALGWSRSLIMSAVIAAVAGAMQFAVTTIANVSIQTNIDDAFRGRVISLFNVAWGGLVPIGGLLLGLMIATLGIAGGMTLSGLLTVIGASGALTLWKIQHSKGRPERG